MGLNVGISMVLLFMQNVCKMAIWNIREREEIICDESYLSQSSWKNWSETFLIRCKSRKDSHLDIRPIEA